MEDFNMNIIRISIVSILILLANLAHAGEPTKLFGKWKFQAPKANIIWEFTSSTITFTSFDFSGKQISKPNTAQISYISLTDNTWGIDFKTADGKPGGGIMAIIKDENNVILDFPGVGGQTLVREK
jgi:hypothetical protein